MRTKRCRLGSGNLPDWNGPVQERQDTLPSGVGRRAQPAIVAHTLKAAGQDVLQESADELHRRHGQDMPLLIFAGLIFETDLSFLFLEKALRAQRRPIDVGGEILEG